MSEILISLPLSAFGDNVSDPIRRVQKFVEASQEIEAEKRRAENYRSTMLQWANHLQSILEQDVDDFQKRQNLRQFARDTTEFCNQIERLHNEATARADS